MEGRVLNDLPRPLLADAKRQAVPSIRGAVYQGLCSIEAWLSIGNDEVVYLEGTEDFDLVSDGESIAVQVKHRVDSLTLASVSALEALENFWRLVNREPERTVEMHYLTTSTIGKERDSKFGGLPGVHAWSMAGTHAGLAEEMRGYLLTKLAPSSPLRAFLANASIEEVQTRLIRQFRWIADQPDVDARRTRIRDGVVLWLESIGRPAFLAARGAPLLEYHYWQTVIEPVSDRRRLTRGDLVRLIDEACTAYLPVPMEQLQRFQEAWSRLPPAPDLLETLREEPPRAPQPLLPRISLLQQIKERIGRGESVLLIGGVHVGKTTLAQLAIVERGNSVSWISLAGRQATEVREVMSRLGELVGPNRTSPS